MLRRDTLPCASRARFCATRARAAAFHALLLAAALQHLIASCGRGSGGGGVAAEAAAHGAGAGVAATHGRAAAAGSPMACSPHDYGAVGDGRTPDTRAVAAAVRACSGGGTVVFAAARRYLLGTVMITGSVHLVLPPTSELLASPQREHYGARQDGWYLLDFHHCTNCSLTSGTTPSAPATAQGGGGGVVRGCAQAFVASSRSGGQGSPRAVLNWRDPSCRVRRQCRPRLVGVRRSAHVRIAGVTLRDSAFWTLHVLDSDFVTVHSVAIMGDSHFPNNDGLDIDGSSHVSVAGCWISTADDALCLKTTGGRRPTAHVHVANCTLRSRSAAVKLGSESRAPMANITFQDLTVLESNRGLAIQLRDWGGVSNVTFARVTVETRRFPGKWWGGGEPLYVTALPRWLGSRVAHARNVTFSHIAAVSHGGPVVLAGSAEAALLGVTLEHVFVRLEVPPPLAAGWRAAGGKHGPPARGYKLDLRPGPYGVRDLKTPAPLVAQFVEGLVLRNVTFELAAAGAEQRRWQHSATGSAGTAAAAAAAARAAGTSASSRERRGGWAAWLWPYAAPAAGQQGYCHLLTDRTVTVALEEVYVRAAGRTTKGVLRGTPAELPWLRPVPALPYFLLMLLLALACIGACWWRRLPRLGVKHA